MQVHSREHHNSEMIHFTGAMLQHSAVILCSALEPKNLDVGFVFRLSDPTSKFFSVENKVQS